LRDFQLPCWLEGITWWFQMVSLSELSLRQNWRYIGIYGYK
jgi:hypothetical protein